MVVDASFTHEEDFFKHENQAAPASLSDNGMLQTSQNSQLTEILQSGLTPCSHKEDDTRVFVHARDATSQGSKSITIKANDTDVVVSVDHAILTRAWATKVVDSVWTRSECSVDSCSRDGFFNRAGEGRGCLPCFHGM